MKFQPPPLLRSEDTCDTVRGIADPPAGKSGILAGTRRSVYCTFPACACGCACACARDQC